jgi:hypothetical protein
MKLLTCLLSILLISFSFAQDDDESAIDKIRQLGGNNLAAYAEPLMEGFGVALGTGIFHTAYTHDILGFDIGMRLMMVGIPNSSRYFTGTAVACSLADGELVCYDVELDSLSTIFGPSGATWVDTEGNAVAIPPVFPGGLDVTRLPFVMPQVSVGLPIGLEFALGYLPLSFTFPLNQESKLRFYRIGGKWSINKAPPSKNIPFPLAIAIGGLYQRGRLEAERGGSVTMTAWNLQLLISKRMKLKYFIDYEPYAAIGVEGTKFNYNYTFEYSIPDTINDIPEDRIEVIELLDIDYRLPNRFRTVLGMTLYFGPVYLHYDYNIVTYKTHNLMLGITIR